jgi:hypothetical protein
MKKLFIILAISFTGITSWAQVQQFVIDTTGVYVPTGSGAPNYLYNNNTGAVIGLGEQAPIKNWGWGFYKVLMGGNVLHAGSKFESYGVNANNTLNYNSGFVLQHNTNHVAIGVKLLHLYSTQVSIGNKLYGNTDYRLTVDGKVRARELHLDVEVWPDYVFSKNYRLKSLYEVEKFINENHHLPGLPSAKEVEKDGVAIAEMVKIQTEKIEELTLYMIELKKENDALKAVVETLRK